MLENVLSFGGRVAVELGALNVLVGPNGELLKQASRRMQIVVTTHSTLLVEALRDPDLLFYFERVAGATRITRGEPTAVKPKGKRRSRP